ncbi:UPF0715 family protein [Bacillus safensis]|uniref:UPF0715 family protein n=1 Tax=Bacillus safensis TaxID=561879 RepID=UPI0038111E5E
MRLFLPVFNYGCMLILSVITVTDVYPFLFMHPEVGFSYVEMTSLFILLACVIFAAPIQLVLHRYPKRFRSRDLLIYFIAAWGGVRLWFYGLIMDLLCSSAIKSICLASAQPLFIGCWIPS